MTASAEFDRVVDARDVARPPIFVVGYPRSGTSLMKSLIGSHPEIAMLRAETHLLSGWRRRFGMDLSDPERFSAFWSEFIATGTYEPDHLERVMRCIRSRERLSMLDVLECVLATHAVSHSYSRPVEKTPDHYKYIDLLLSRFPGCQVVFIIRDPRAVLASWRDFDSSWTERSTEAIVVNWRRSVYELERWTRHSSVWPVRYEDLVAQPDREVAQVLSFLGLDVPHGILDRKGSGRLHGKYDLHGPVGTGSVERWRELLSDEEITWLEKEVCADMRRYGYAPSRRVPAFAKVASEAKRLYYKTRYLAGRHRRRLSRNQFRGREL